jgi:hypothetical protein
MADENNKPVSQFLKEMRDAGVEFTFTASNGVDKFTGRCYPNNEGKMTLETMRHPQEALAAKT